MRAPMLALGALLFASAAQAGPWEDFIGEGVTALRAGKFAEAEKNFAEALEEAETFGTNDMRIGATLDYLAQVYVEQKEFAKAEKAVTKSIEIWDKGLTPDHPAYGFLAERIAVLGDIHSMQEKYVDAERLLRRALNMLFSIYGPGHPEMAAPLDSYAELLRKTGREAEAAQMERRANSLRPMFTAPAQDPDPPEEPPLGP